MKLHDTKITKYKQIEVHYINTGQKIVNWEVEKNQKMEEIWSDKHKTPQKEPNYHEASTKHGGNNAL